MSRKPKFTAGDRVRIQGCEAVIEYSYQDKYPGAKARDLYAVTWDTQGKPCTAWHEAREMQLVDAPPHR